MSWDAIGAIGEIAGAVAVVASLVYVSYQLKQNTSAIRGDRYHSINSKMIDLYSNWADSDRLPAILNKLGKPGTTSKDFDEDDQVRVRLMLQCAARLLEDIYRQVSEGNLPEEALEHLGGVSWFLLPIAGEIWPQMTTNFSNEFIEYMENRFGYLSSDNET
jgi:hypothetical protein